MFRALLAHLQEALRKQRLVNVFYLLLYYQLGNIYIYFISAW
jgi:hypothetical protein